MESVLPSRNDFPTTMRDAALVLVTLSALVASGGFAAVAAGPATPAVDGPPAGSPLATSAGSTALHDASATEQSAVGVAGFSLGVDQSAARTGGVRFGPPRTTFRIDLGEDGDARWTITARYALDGPVDRAAFRRFADRYENGTTDLGPSPSVWRAAAEAASGTTDRSMAVTDVQRRGRIDDETTGVLELKFVWTDFVERVGVGQFRLYDAFKSGTEGGNRTWLPSLSENQTLVIVAPPNSGITSSNFPFDRRTIRIDGPREIPFGRIDVSYQIGDTETRTPTPTPTPTESPSPTPTTPPTTSPPTTPPDTTPPPNDSSDIVWFGAVVVVIAAAVFAMFYRQGGLTGDRVLGPGPDDVAGTATGTTDAETATPPAPEAELPEPEPEPDEPEEDLELLSDEERVERLLERNGGRMRQAAIVDETGWSDAKVSQLLSRMADEDRVDKLRLGRENLISLPDVDDPTDEE
jgi:uncharacterized membrane protein